MKIMIVGGATGMVGGHAALYLKSKGYDVTVAGRTPPKAGTPLGDLPFDKIDYINGSSFPAGFDALVFCAGHDTRSSGADDEAYWAENAKAAPRFIALARDAGVKVAVNIGSFYPWVLPELVESNAYVRPKGLRRRDLRLERARLPHDEPQRAIHRRHDRGHADPHVRRLHALCAGQVGAQGPEALSLISVHRSNAADRRNVIVTIYLGLLLWRWDMGCPGALTVRVPAQAMRMPSELLRRSGEDAIPSPGRRGANCVL